MCVDSDCSRKIKNQAKVLEIYKLPQSSMLMGYIDELELNDKSNREGHAAKVYFNALFGKSFSRNDECPINAALNYGYSIVLSVLTEKLQQMDISHNWDYFTIICLINTI